MGIVFDYFDGVISQEVLAAGKRNCRLRPVLLYLIEHEVLNLIGVELASLIGLWKPGHTVATRQIAPSRCLKIAQKKIAGFFSWLVTFHLLAR